MFTLSVESNFELFTRVHSEKPPMCLYDDTMGKIEDRIPSSLQQVILDISGNLQSFRYHGLGCEPYKMIQTMPLEAL